MGGRSFVRRVPLKFVCLAIGLAGVLAACGGIDAVTPENPLITDPTQLYTSLTLDHRAITLSTSRDSVRYYTLQLTATPRDALGNPMSGLPAPVFQSLDANSVTVTPNGLLTALAVTSETRITVTVTAGQLKHADTALVRVTNLTSPPVLDTLSIQPLAPDSAVVSIEIGGNHWTATLLDIFGVVPAFRVLRVPARMVTSFGEPIADLMLDYTSLDPAIADFPTRRTPELQVFRPGQARLVARATAYGIPKADTMTFTVTMPVTQTVDAALVSGAVRFFGVTAEGRSSEAVIPTSDVRIAPYGIVGWGNKSADSVDVVFDDPTDVVSPPPALCEALQSELGPNDLCGAGNFVMTPGGSSLTEAYQTISFRLRQFPKPGIYPFHSMRYGASGRVIVTNDPE